MSQLPLDPAPPRTGDLRTDKGYRSCRACNCWFNPYATPGKPIPSVYICLTCRTERSSK